MRGIKGRRFIVLFGYKLNQFGIRCPHDLGLINKACKQYHSNQHFSGAFYLQNGGELNGGHRYETKLRHCRPMYKQQANRHVISASTKLCIQIISSDANCMDVMMLFAGGGRSQRRRYTSATGRPTAIRCSTYNAVLYCLNSFLAIIHPDPCILPIQISLPDQPVLLATFPLGSFLCL